MLLILPTEVQADAARNGGLASALSASEQTGLHLLRLRLLGGGSGGLAEERGLVVWLTLALPSKQARLALSALVALSSSAEQAAASSEGGALRILVEN